MTETIDRADRALAAWLQEGPELGPEEALRAALAQTHGVRQRPAWSFPRRWVPMDVLPQLGRRPVPIAILLLLVALSLLAAAAILIVGSQRHLPPPFGPAANGRILYDTGPGGGTYLADRDGSNPRRISAEGVERFPAFSPDGTKLAFWSRPAGNATPTMFRLYVADADGTHAHPISGGSWFEAWHNAAPSWSPDSTRLAFAAGDGDQSRIWVVAADGSGPAREITDARASRDFPAWSPDGQWIAMTELSAGSAPSHAISVIRPDGSDLRVLHRQAAGDPNVEGGFGGPLAWSPDSRRIAYSRGRDPARADEPDYSALLEVVSLDGREVNIGRETSGWIEAVSWSPDGRSIAFVGGYPATAIEVVGADGAGLHVAARCKDQIATVDWSPDGSWLTVSCPGNPQIVSATGGLAPSAMPLPSGAAAIDIQRVAP